MPKRLVCSGVGEVAWQEVPSRELNSTEIRVKCTYGAEKHGTMMAFYKGYANERGRWDQAALMHRPDEGVLWGYPIPLGNAQAGTVIEAGPESGKYVGDAVFFSGPFCPEVIVKGTDAWPWPDGVAWESLMLLDPGEFALGAIRDGNLRAGDNVAIFGLGAIGLCLVQLARLAGAANVIAIDPVSQRREIALATGASIALDPTTTDVGAAIREVTGGTGADVVIDFSGSRPALQAGLRGVGYLGTIVYGAFPPPFGAGLDLGGEAHMNRPRIVFSRACSDPNPDHPRWSHRRIQEAVYSYIADGHLRGEYILSEPVPFESLLTEYPRIAAEAGSLIKLAVEYP